MIIKRIHKNGTVRWTTFPDIVNECHREETPAIIYEDGTTAWFSYGGRFRNVKDGATSIRPNGQTMWTMGDIPLNGHVYYEDEWK